MHNRGLNIEESLLFEKEDSSQAYIEPHNDISARAYIPTDVRKDLDLPNIAESEVVRHFVRLSQKNFSIDTGFYPLGSCTMKHNPRLNEKIARFDGFANIHPLQDESTIQGALEVMYELQNWLGKLSGLPAICLTPAAGAQGEMAGLLTIRKYHKKNGSNHKKYVIVPDSAHGTNPATVKMCGFDIKTVSSNKKGTVDIDQLNKIVSDEVAGMMITNPNTCGVFEHEIANIADILHKHDALLYCDGANFNALMGKEKLSDCGIDIMHFNLHKTFSTPHGGGGPGSGPIAAIESLKEFLPYPIVKYQDNKYKLYSNKASSIGRIKAFHGHFGMFVRALAYMKALGIDGLTQATEDAVLSANYIFYHLKKYYHAPFDEYCMHECLLTDRKQKDLNITTLDIAKTLMENGIHPMTIYFPLIVQGAMLIEPTETETKENIDQFIDIMQNIAISEDIEKIKNNPLHTPRRRLDEVTAAKRPKLTFDMIEK